MRSEPSSPFYFLSTILSCQFTLAGDTGHVMTPIYQLAVNDQNHERGIADLGNELETLENQNKFLEMIVVLHETNLLKIYSYVVCEN